MKIHFSQASPSGQASSSSGRHGQASSSRPPNYKVEELKLNIKDGVNGEAMEVSLGLTAGGSRPLKLLGSYSGSIGFNLNGCLS
ncbi:hypothetical protein NL676_027561 [Syzygium grande]|nr:hypothetical protein NL676_027561 [Syzygium grande]